MKKSLSQILTGTILAIGLLPITWFFFGPIAGFHHMIGCGITFYLTLDGESPEPDCRTSIRVDRQPAPNAQAITRPLDYASLANTSKMPHLL
jgi:hypothetical protein